MIFSFPRLAAYATAIVLVGCASQRVVYHPSRQQPKAPVTSAPAPSRPVAPTAPPPAYEPQPAPVVTSPAVPLYNEPLGNLTELRKNLSNTRAAEDIIEEKLTLAELEVAAATPAFSSVKPQLLLTLGKRHQKARQRDRAAEYYRSVSTLYPKTTQATQAAALLATIQMANTPADARVVGAVLPLTGRMASIGQHALNAIRLGLELNKPDTKLRLALFDSQSNADLAAQGVSKLVRDDKAIVILGGFTSAEATAIAHQSELLGIPFIGFSQKTGLTQIGENIFRNALTPEMQVDTLVQFAFDKLSARKFAIIFPNDSYGTEFSNIFWDHVLARGGQITAAQTYDPKETDFSEVTRKVLGTFYPEARPDEYREGLAQLKANRRKTKGGGRDNWGEENILKPIVDFDVIFIPDSSRALGQIMAFMKYNEVRDMNYIGTNLWNSPDLPNRAGDEDAGLYFVDGLDISQGNPQDNEFFKNYFAQYNETPTLLEIQAYEAAQIVKTQLASGASNREDLASRMRYLGRAKGVTGELRMSNQRELERPVHVLTLDEGLVKKMQ